MNRGDMRPKRNARRGMTFRCGHTTYDSTAMRRFNTGRLHEPALFVSSDGGAVFVQTMRRDVGVAIHRADAAEVGRLWREYAWVELAGVLGLSGNPSTLAPVRTTG